MNEKYCENCACGGSAELAAFVRDLADHGTRHDLHPTLLGWRDARDLGARYDAYLTSLDDAIRRRAREALGTDHPDTERHRLLCPRCASK